MNKEIDKIKQDLISQDNRITADPIFVVEEKSRIYGVDEEYADGFDWFKGDYDWEMADERQSSTLDKLEQLCRKTYPWVKIGYIDKWKFVTACFTEQGCKDYLDLNGHNHKNETRIFVYGAYRNEEWKSIREFMLNYGE